MPREATRKVITDAMVQRVKPAPKGKRIEHWDAVVPGFGLRVTDAGGKSFFLRTRSGAEQLRMSWPYPATSLGAAREAAKAVLSDLSQGIDPKEKKVEAEREAARTKANTIEEVCALFIERYAKPKNKSWQETDRTFKANVIPRWSGRPVTKITKRDVIDLLDSVIDRGSPIMANRVLACVRKLFGWCVERGILEHSPAAGIKAPGREVSRDRVLSDDELVAVWRAASAQGWPFGPLVQLLILTAQRRDEVGEMAWDEIDFERALWTIPRERAKNGLAHEVPLSRPALELLSNLPRVGSLVFTTTGKTAVSGFSKAKASIDTKMLKSRQKALTDAGADPKSATPMADWIIHDLRRTATTGMAQLGVPPHIADKILNHKTGSIQGVAAVYNRHGYLEERRHALEAWAAQVERLLKPAATEKVVRLKR